MPSVIRGSDGFDSGAGARPVAEYVVTGANVTQIDLTGLDLAAQGGRYDIEAVYINGSSTSTCGYSLFVNDDLVDTNYTRQILLVSSATVSGARYNDAEVSSIIANNRGHASYSMVLDTAGWLTMSGQTQRAATVNTQGLTYWWSKNAQVSTVSKITIKASQAGGFGVGSSVRVFRRNQ